jgi:hypothetical protein
VALAKGCKGGEGGVKFLRRTAVNSPVTTISTTLKSASPAGLN